MGERIHARAHAHYPSGKNRGKTPTNHLTLPYVVYSPYRMAAVTQTTSSTNATTVPESPSPGFTELITIATVIPLLIIVVLSTAATVCFCVYRRWRMQRRWPIQERRSGENNILKYGLPLPERRYNPSGPSQNCRPQSDTIERDILGERERWSISAASGASNELSDDSMSCPPSPVVSSLYLEEDHEAVASNGINGNSFSLENDNRTIHLPSIGISRSLSENDNRAIHLPSIGISRSLSENDNRLNRTIHLPSIRKVGISCSAPNIDSGRFATPHRAIEGNKNSATHQSSKAAPLACKTPLHELGTIKSAAEHRMHFEPHSDSDRSNYFSEDHSATHKISRAAPLTRKSETGTTQNTEHHMNRQSSELHSDYYSGYHSRLVSEQRSSRYGGGTRTDRSDYYSEDRSGRHSPPNEHHKRRSLSSHPTRASPEYPTIAPMIEFGSQNLYHNQPLERDKEEEVVDSIVLEAISGYLVHQDSCSISRCPCRKMKKQFSHLTPQAHRRHMHIEEQLIDQQKSQRRHFLQFPPHATHHQPLTEKPGNRNASGASVSFETHTHNQSSTPRLESHKCTNRKSGLPECMTPTTTLFRCSSKKTKFDDEANDFSLEIPEGAIPEGKTLTIDIGVALQGPFQFPEGLRPISPVFGVCVRDQPNIQFSKPVTVEIPHFLNIKNCNEIQSLGLTFIKADHKVNSEKLYEFHPTEGTTIFEPLKKCGVLKTTHFCSLCIACRDTPECLQKTPFCITAILPSVTIPVGKKVYGYFFITFLNLQTCLVKVDELVEKMPKAEQYERDMQPFEFKTETQIDPAIEIAIIQPTRGKIGLKGNRRVSQHMHATINFWCACAELQYLVCVSVLSLCLSKTIVGQEATKLYPAIQCNKRLKN